MKIEVKVFAGKEVYKHTENIPDAVTATPRFIKLPDGWIRDFSQGLDWGPSSTKNLSYSDADKYCISKNGRMPSRKELDNLLNLTKKIGICIDMNFFMDTKSEWYWTSTNVVWASSPSRWCVSFGSGSVVISYESYCSYVRPVRASQ